MSIKFSKSLVIYSDNDIHSAGEVSVTAGCPHVRLRNQFETLRYYETRDYVHSTREAFDD